MRARTIDEYDVTIPIPHVRVTSQINCSNVTFLLITSMALAHPLHPITSRSRNKRRNLWVGWCVSSWRPWFWPVHSIYYIHIIHYSCHLSNKKAFSKSQTNQKLAWPCWCVGWYDTFVISSLASNVQFNCIVQNSLYHNMDKGTMWRCELVSSTPSQSTGLVLGCALFWCWVSLGAHVTCSFPW